MKFITKKETFFNKKLRGVGEVIESNEKLDELRPDIFQKAGGKTGAAPKYDVKTSKDSGGEVKLENIV